MTNYYNYLPLVKDDDNWGLCVLNAGYMQIGADCGYPLNGHPEKYDFNWQSGRVLSEYQLIYVTDGEGIFESESFGSALVKPGTVILLFPGERHRYKPSRQTGWNEYWIGFKGAIMDDLVKRNIFSPGQPCIELGFNEQAFSLFNSIIEKTRQQHIHYQPQISGATMHLLGCIHSLKKEPLVPLEEKQLLVDKAKLLFRSRLMSAFSPEQAAKELAIGYSYFRKLFKSYTGVSPGQFYIQLKIEKAKEMLNDRNIPIKEIAYGLHFESYFYFSKLFKDKTGSSPTAFRALTSCNSF
jgi:AraC-like DNA-binding protein